MFGICMVYGMGMIPLPILRLPHAQVSFLVYGRGQAAEDRRTVGKTTPREERTRKTTPGGRRRHERREREKREQNSPHSVDPTVHTSKAETLSSPLIAAALEEQSCATDLKDR